ncbi:MAG: SRPBCC domain-containing protein [Ferruginibacter sp.]|nr:ATPase [Ferruginibacter sp.]
MKDFKKYYTLQATPEEVFAALTNAPTIQLWSGSPAKMSTEVNSEFSLWEGSIEGVNLEFEKDKKIVQQWYFGDQEDPSIVTIKLFEDKNKTSLELRHTNIPDQDYDDIVAGWNDAYMGSLIEFYED